jgi:hypothetical protein
MKDDAQMHEIVESLIRAFLQSPDARTEWLDEIVQRERVLPLYLG